tara:strand:- start:1055 stop:1456 length:402 start_codon:yes stop_codon:yes gene_type:complete
MNYIIYKEATGEIVRVGHCSSDNDHLVSGKCREGESVLEGSVSDPSTQMVKNGALVSKPQDEIDAAASAEASSINRLDRNSELTATDWTQVSDAPLTDSKKAEWRVYRQALRDLPAHTNWPLLNEEDWPDAPT